MSTSEWPQMDTSPVEISPGTIGTETSSDLFGGDLFGDELLDMYHSAVVGNGGTDGVDSIPNDVLSPPVMPNLLLRIKGGNDGTDHDLPNPINSNEYDGLTVFGPSTSMNDFTNLLENSNVSVIPPPPSAPVPMLPIKTSDPISVPTGIGGAILEQSKKRSNAECNNISNMSLPHAPDLSIMNKKRVTSDDKGNTNVDIGQFITTAGLNKVKEEDASPGLNNDQRHHPGNIMQRNTPDPFSMNIMRGGGLMNNISMGPVGVTNTINATCKVGPLSTPGISTIPVPSSNLTVKMMPVNSSIMQTTARSGISKEIIPIPPSQASIKTEESFKVVAQAAVTNLILSAGSNPPRFDLGHNVTDSDSDSSQHLKPVNTTSAHVAALTSNNWVAACAASINNAPPGTVAAAQAAALAAASDPAAAKAARARRATLTADERARQNRDRNREHARNTRLRKKAYVEELKRTLTELVAQRDAQDLERRHEKQRDLEVREVRYRVMEEFLKLRARGSDANLLARWVAILEDGFTLTLPKTEYRTMVENQSTAMKRQVSIDNGSTIKSEAHTSYSSNQVLRGATECLEDASKVASFINTLVPNNNTHSSNIATMSYLCDRKHFMMDGVNAVLDWSTSTSGATAQGAISDLNVKGCMRATFSPASNKLICAELLFDTGIVSSFLNTIMHDQQVITNTNGSSLNNLCTTDTDALLDSVLPPVTSEANGMSSNITIISYEKGDSSSDEDYSTRPN